MTELARVRAAPDPHYGLPVVVCPSCSKASVRTRHPDIQFWRNFRRLHRSLRSLVFTVLLSIGLGALMLGLVMWARGMNPDAIGSIDPAERVGAWASLVLIPMLACASGCVVRLLYAHRHAMVPFAVLLVLGSFFTWIDYIFFGLSALMAEVGGYRQPYFSGTLDDFVHRGMLLALLMIFALIGLLPARVLMRRVRGSDARRFRRLRRKRRKGTAKSD